MAEEKDAGNIEALLEEKRVFEPPESFRANALVKDDGIYREATDDLEGFWARQAERLEWSRPWDSVLEWDAPVGEVVLRRTAERLG